MEIGIEQEKALSQGGFEKTYEALFALETASNYFGLLIQAWTKVLIEDNRRGVMMGIDGDGNPMKPTKYRLSLTQTGAGSAGDTFFNVQGQAIDSFRSGGLFHNALIKPGPSANLTTKQYQQMTGPPLAPRGAASRVISNYTVEPLAGQNMVGVEGGWDDVVSKKGVPFLPFHFRGATFSRALFAASIGGDNHHLPQRNLVGLRQWGKTQARKELNAWIKHLLTVMQIDYFGRRGAGHAPKYVRNKAS